MEKLSSSRRMLPEQDAVLIMPEQLLSDDSTTGAKAETYSVNRTGLRKRMTLTLNGVLPRSKTSERLPR